LATPSLIRIAVSAPIATAKAPETVLGPSATAARTTGRSASHAIGKVTWARKPFLALGRRVTRQGAKLTSRTRPRNTSAPMTPAMGVGSAPVRRSMAWTCTGRLRIVRPASRTAPVSAVST
jgi:hypothetical protein